MSADLDALVALMPFAGQLGLVLDEAGADRVVARLDWAPHLCTTAGVLHGGVLMSLADSAGALVTFLGLAHQYLAHLVVDEVVEQPAGIRQDLAGAATCCSRSLVKCARPE